MAKSDGKTDGHPHRHQPRFVVHRGEAARDRPRRRRRHPARGRRGEQAARLDRGDGRRPHPARPRELERDVRERHARDAASPAPRRRHRHPRLRAEVRGPQERGLRRRRPHDDLHAQRGRQPGPCGLGHGRGRGRRQGPGGRCAHGRGLAAGGGAARRRGSARRRHDRARPGAHRRRRARPGRGGGVPPARRVRGRESHRQAAEGRRQADPRRLAAARATAR